MSDDYDNPWQTLNSTVVYDNPWIRVQEDAVIRPDGAPGIYGTVHFKNQAVGVVPIDDEGYIYLVGQYRYTLNQYSWEIPEGGSPEGEEPLATAQRELMEETGLTALEWSLISVSHLSNSVSDEIAFCYLATGLTVGEAEPEGSEKLKAKRLPFTEALDMVEQGKITDALSVIGITRYALMQMRRR